jgi:hypothetical protein
MMNKGQRGFVLSHESHAGLFTSGGVGKRLNPSPLHGGALAGHASSNLAAVSITKEAAMRPP